jgi:hypothetical protein
MDHAPSRHGWRNTEQKGVGSKEAVIGGASYQSGGDKIPLADQSECIAVFIAMANPRKGRWRQLSYSRQNKHSILGCSGLLLSLFAMRETLKSLIFNRKDARIAKEKIEGFTDIALRRFNQFDGSRVPNWKN